MNKKDSRPGILALFAHPDDETFRCGGTLSLLAEAGARVQVVSFTAGGAGSCGDPPLCAPAELTNVRSLELACSCATLGLLKPIILDDEDGSLEKAQEDQAVERVLQIIDEFQPRVIITWPAHGLSGHPDHCAVSRWVSLSIERRIPETNLQDAALYHLAVPHSVADRLGMTALHSEPDDRITVCVQVGKVWERKLSAIRCHKTQAGESPILKAGEDRQRLFLEKEWFVRASSPGGEDPLSMLEKKQKEELEI